MGRDTSGVAGMRLRAGDEVIEVDIATDDADLLVVTDQGYGKRTRVGDYPVKGRGTMGVKTAQLVDRKGRLAGARIVRDGYQVMLISDAGTVIKIPVDGIRRAGRATQGVIVMRLREGEKVATLASVVGSDEAEIEIEPMPDDAALEPALEPPPEETPSD
jgi:DNA gyrase subunit A